MARELEHVRRPAPSQALVPTGREPSTASLVRDALGDAVEVFQAHVELAAIEIREDARAAGRIVIGFGIGAALTLFALGFLGAAAAFGLAAVVAIGMARRKLTTHDFTPEQTIGSLQEIRDGRPTAG